jgi:hypothetical protein
MRFSERNKQPVWYSTFVSKTEIVDEYGNSTGEYEITYTAPAKTAWNVNVVESEADVAMFGVQAMDTIVGVAPRNGFPLDETSILWYGITPTIKEDGTTDTAHNYRVVGIRPSLNTVKFYAQRVDVTQVVAQEPVVDPDPEEPIDDPPVGGEGE